ncbi:hypothetical protein, partial [Paraburkholderia sp. XV]|uniref:hypothetical protein n=1 Tax=Paraburkholderia sp. XV TaxID=2831520 RepID=UPI001CD4C2DD
MSATLGGLFVFAFFCWHPGFVIVLQASPFARLAFSLASALRYRASGVAPVRGGTYFSLPP